MSQKIKISSDGIVLPFPNRYRRPDAELPPKGWLGRVLVPAAAVLVLAATVPNPFGHKVEDTGPYSYTQLDKDPSKHIVTPDGGQLNELVLSIDPGLNANQLTEVEGFMEWQGQISGPDAGLSRKQPLDIPIIPEAQMAKKPGS